MNRELILLFLLVNAGGYRQFVSKNVWKNHQYTPLIFAQFLKGGAYHQARERGR